ncbi:hypothetical protein [Luteimonas sp. MC1572]|uniref:hypothetical protein n=1 Tax=Luteimonas sp. MC1572 TaxID=2799325 RepID=UPI0018F0732B|nr:hypothetical protein [Luteimonas sp. MC1572]MBJ6982031.1 hypothetical protein [Luteimonas sp. MC1572]
MDDHRPLPPRTTQRVLTALAFALALSLALGAGTCSNHATDTPAVDAFFAHVEARDGARWLEEEADDHIATLADNDALALAHRALTHADADVRLYGLGLLYRFGLNDEADAAAAELLIRGDDLAGLGWGWLHSGDPTLLETRLDGIRAALVRRLPALPAERRQAAEAFLCTGQEACAEPPGE